MFTVPHFAQFAMTTQMELTRLQQKIQTLQTESVRLQHAICASVRAQVTAPATIAGAAALGAMAALVLPPRGSDQAKASAGTAFSRAAAAASSIVGALAKVVGIMEVLSSSKDATRTEQSPAPLSESV